MRALGLSLILFACSASAQWTQPQPMMSLEALQAFKVKDSDCPRREQIIAGVQRQLELRGIGLNADPATLSKQDVEYNATAKIIIWSFRIGCANPDRYSKK
jgi:hypothetical protein